jgi:vacuolar-type H+-ATPase subunit H
LTGTLLDNMIDEARSLAAMSLPEDRDTADKLVNDMLDQKVNEIVSELEMLLEECKAYAAEMIGGSEPPTRT